MILADQIAHALAKKQARARKAEEQRRETRPLDGFGESAPAGCLLELGAGTPADGTGGGVRPGDGARARRRALPQGFARSRGGLVTALSVESLVFVLKHGCRFGRLGRTGLEAVRRELAEKVIAYNQDRLILLQKQKAEAPPKAA